MPYTSEDEIKMHCQNCAVLCKRNDVRGPNGKLYRVCDSCVSLVESGEARCVKHHEYLH